ncbi:ABC transporter permease [Bacillus sp. JJ1566]|uniref:ABC transporter permease n=1 Tax=Bacillus sp. JJ1566 TaxID=3122961 RepID=UPI003F68B75B
MIISRIATSLIAIFGSLVLVFTIMNLLPGDPVMSMIDPNTATPEMIEALRVQLGLDQPLYMQFWNYISGMLVGDFGTSFANSEPVLPKIIAHLPATLFLTLMSAIFSVVIGVSLGVLSAIYQNRWIDILARLVALFGISMPTFWSGILLIMIFSLQLGWFPAMGSDGFMTLILPSLSLGFIGAGLIIRMVRSSMVEVINEQFIVTLRAKGLSERIVMYRHALRNALIPAITIIGINIGELMAGTVVIETVFSRQGLGRVIADAILAKDLPVIQGAVFISAIVYVTVNLLVDLSYSVIDPRVRRSS